MNHVSYSVNFIVKNASNFEDLNMDTVTQYLNTRNGPMSSTGMSQVKYITTSKRRSFVTFILYFKCWAETSTVNTPTKTGPVLHKLLNLKTLQNIEIFSLKIN